MIKIDTENASGTILISGDINDVVTEMYATMSMFYKALERKNKGAAYAFKNTLEKNLSEILEVPFEEIEFQRGFDFSDK